MTDNLRDRIAAAIDHRRFGCAFDDDACKRCQALSCTYADEAIRELETHQQRSTCGGCRGLGKHSPRCHTQPGALWRRLADMAESLGDQIGSNDTTLANRAYDLMSSLRAKGGL